MTTYEQVRRVTQVLLRNQAPITPTLIREQIQVAKLTLPKNAEAFDEEVLARELEAVHNIWMGTFTVLEEDDVRKHVPWLADRRADIKWRFWRRYEQFLEEEKGMAPAAIQRLDQITDAVLERLEEPARKGTWDRRGMVVGQVQSGKTANYTGLICKAADAGYKLIIVLAGIHKSLRSQTQLRLDEGFLGFDTQHNRRFDQDNARIGVGLIPSAEPLIAHSLTSSEDHGDFKAPKAKSLGVQIGGADPVLLVVKKNKSVLDNLYRWATGLHGMTDPSTGKRIVRGIPLLIIDDEADNASINTNPELDAEGSPVDPTAINKAIRALLNSFEQSAYVAYTATPFANIFIHPETSTETHGEDLFPRSFIISLPEPSNYVGPAQVFGLRRDIISGIERRDPLPIVETIDDYSSWMPDKHDRFHSPGPMPGSLLRAIKAFIITCAVRSLRSQSKEHSSMLVHVTRFTDVQRKVVDQVKDELGRLRRHLEFGDGASPEPAIEEFRELWEEHFIPTSARIAEIGGAQELMPGWQAVKDALFRAASRIQVKTINGTARDVLDYYSHKDGLHVIAVGGDKLSRGLTLEGLSISYYLRASRMYDTLMQMGRWFGYRPGYLDLCRLYTPSDLKKWYEDITMASEELRIEFDEMAAADASPDDFGLKVRSHPSGLIVTAANKMRAGTKMLLTYSGDISETIVFHTDHNVMQANVEAVESFLEVIAEYKADDPDNYMWEGVPSTAVIEFLERFSTHPDSRRANSKRLAKYINLQNQLDDPELTSWTIALLSNSQSEGNIPSSIAGLALTTFTRKDESEKLREKYSIGRLLSPKDEAIDLDPDEYMTALSKTKFAWEERRAAKKAAQANVPVGQEAEDKEKDPPSIPGGTYIRRVRPWGRGLLLIYPITPPFRVGGSVPFVGIGLSFPNSPNAEPIEYVANPVFVDQEQSGNDGQ